MTVLYWMSYLDDDQDWKIVMYISKKMLKILQSIIQVVATYDLIWQLKAYI